MKRTIGLALLLAISITAFGVVGVGTAGAVNIGNEGCTPGYWKTHTDNWEEYSPDTLLGDVFTIPANLSSWNDVTFLEALDGGGGPGLDGAAEILFRAAVASFLNAAHEGVGFPWRRFDEPGNILAKVNAALASGDRQTMLDLAAQLDALNNLGCPLN